MRPPSCENRANLTGLAIFGAQMQAGSSESGIFQRLSSSPPTRSSSEEPQDKFDMECEVLVSKSCMRDHC